MVTGTRGISAFHSDEDARRATSVIFHLSPFPRRTIAAAAVCVPRLNFGRDLRGDYANLFCESALRKIAARCIIHRRSCCIISTRSLMARRDAPQLNARRRGPKTGGRRGLEFVEETPFYFQSPRCSIAWRSERSNNKERNGCNAAR